MRCRSRKKKDQVINQSEKCYFKMNKKKNNSVHLVEYWECVIPFLWSVVTDMWKSKHFGKNEKFPVVKCLVGWNLYNITWKPDKTVLIQREKDNQCVISPTWHCFVSQRLWYWLYQVGVIINIIKSVPNKLNN